jgi:hypothetical protein
VSGDNSIKSLDEEASRTALKAALEAWHMDWIKSRVLRRFNELPDDTLNARIWNLASRCSKTLGATAEIVKSALDAAISLEECLNRIADTFSDSEEQFQRAQSEMVVVDSFIKGTPAREEILSYLSGCDITEVDEIEEMREQLYQLVDAAYWNPSDASNRELGYLWIKFQRDFTEYFATRHDAVMRSHSLQASFQDIIRGEDWWEFENLARISLFDPAPAEDVHRLRRKFAELDCDFAVRDALRNRPFCRCSFGITKEKSWEQLPQTLSDSIHFALRVYREVLQREKATVTAQLEKIENGATDKVAAAAATVLIDSIRKGEEIPRFSLIQLQILQKALGTIPDAARLLRENYDLSRANASAEVRGEVITV